MMIDERRRSAVARGYSCLSELFVAPLKQSLVVPATVNVALLLRIYISSSR
jgi:hypothetical protein